MADSDTGCRYPKEAGQNPIIKAEDPAKPVIPVVTSHIAGGGFPPPGISDATVPTIAPVINAVQTSDAAAPATSTEALNAGQHSSGLKPSAASANKGLPSSTGQGSPDKSDPVGGNGGTGSYSGPKEIKAPHYVIYSDEPLKDRPFPTPEQLGGFNRFLLCFWMVLTPGGDKLAPYDNARKWAETEKAERSALKQNYKDAGIALMVSAFGATGEEEFLGT